MSPLEEIARGIDEDGRPPLAWVVEHAPDGDIDAAIRRVWDAAPADPWSFKLYQRMSRYGTRVGRGGVHGTEFGSALHAVYCHWDSGSCSAIPGDDWSQKPCYLAVFRAQCPPPALAAWLAAMEAPRCR